MAPQIVFTPNAPKPPATYSQAVKAAGLVFVSGTGPQDPATGTIKATTIQEQTRQCLTNIAAILQEAGSSLDRIVSAVVSVQPSRASGCQTTGAHTRAQDFHRRSSGGLKP